MPVVLQADADPGTAEWVDGIVPPEGTATSVQAFIYDTTFDLTAPLYTSPVLTTDLIGATRGLRVGLTSQYLPAGTVTMWKFYKATLLNRNGSVL